MSVPRCSHTKNRDCRTQGYCTDESIEKIGSITTIKDACNAWATDSQFVSCAKCLDSRYVSYIDQNCGIAAAGSTSSVFSAPSKGLSSAAVAGIAAGVIGVALGLCVLLIFLLAGRRKKRAQVQAAQAAAQAAPASGAVLPPKAMDEVLPKYAEKDDMFPPTYEVNETKEAA